MLSKKAYPLAWSTLCLFTLGSHPIVGEAQTFEGKPARLTTSPNALQPAPSKLDDYSQTSPAPVQESAAPKQSPTRMRAATLPGPSAVVGPAFDVATIPSGGSAPDVGGAVGKKHVISLQNVGRSTQMKSGLLLSNSSHIAFWQPVTAPTYNPFDPRIHVDHSNSRFVATAIRTGSPGLPPATLFAYSLDQSGTNWQQFAFTIEPQCQWNFDFPRMAISKDYVAIAVFAYSSGSSTPCSNSGERLIVIPKSGLYTATSITPTVLTPPTPGYISPFGASAAAMAGTDGRLYVTRMLPNGTHYAVYRITNQVPSPGSPISLETVHASLPLPVVSASGTLVNKMLNETRTPLCNNGITGTFHNNHLYFSYSANRPLVSNPSQTISSVAWSELDLATGTQVQGGELPTNDTNAFLCPSSWANQHGMIISFTLTNASIYGSPAFVFRRSTDPMGQMSAATIYMAGTAPFNSANPSPILRTGDFGTTMEDPTNACKFWAVNQVGRPNIAASAWGQIDICQ